MHELHVAPRGEQQHKILGAAGSTSYKTGSLSIVAF